MKKLLGLLAATNLVAFSTSTVIACSNSDGLKLVDGKTNKNLQEVLRIEVSQDKKLEKDYKEQDAVKEKEGEPGIEKKPGADLEKFVYFDDVKTFFTQTKDLKEYGNDDEDIMYEFLIKGKIGDTSVMLYIIKEDESSLTEESTKGIIKVTTLFEYKITLEAPVVPTADLKDLEVIEPVEGQSLYDLYIKIQKAVKKIEPNAGLDFDYTIDLEEGAIVGKEGEEVLVKDKKITITAQKVSLRIKGKKEITISPKPPIIWSN